MGRDESPSIELPKPHMRGGELGVGDALARRRSVRRFAGGPLPLESAAQLLWAAQGTTGVEGRRTAASAGALYPLELYLVAGEVSGLGPGVYRYDTFRHDLMRHATGDLRVELADAAAHQYWIAEAPAVLAIAATYARSAVKYAARAARYVHIEVGHAAGNVGLEAVALGVATTMVGAFVDRRVQQVLCLPPEAEPLLLLPVGAPRRS